MSHYKTKEDRETDLALAIYYEAKRLVEKVPSRGVSYYDPMPDRLTEREFEPITLDLYNAPFDLFDECQIDGLRFIVIAWQKFYAGYSGGLPWFKYRYTIKALPVSSAPSA